MEAAGQHGPNAQAFVSTTPDKYDANYMTLARMNPQLYDISKQIDLSNFKIQQLENERMNIQKAQDTMF